VVGEQILKSSSAASPPCPARVCTRASRIPYCCAPDVTEASHLKAVVSATDPQAFVIVSPAQEILGRGFLPLKPDGENSQQRG